jgi:hypothetical protein
MSCTVRVLEFDHLRREPSTAWTPSSPTLSAGSRPHGTSMNGTINSETSGITTLPGSLSWRRGAWKNCRPGRWAGRRGGQPGRAWATPTPKRGWPERVPSSTGRALARPSVETAGDPRDLDRLVADEWDAVGDQSGGGGLDADPLGGLDAGLLVGRMVPARSFLGESYGDWCGVPGRLPVGRRGVDVSLGRHLLVALAAVQAASAGVAPGRLGRRSASASCRRMPDHGFGLGVGVGDHAQQAQGQGSGKVLECPV